MRYLYPVLLAGIVLVIFAASPAQAMPEYAARVGEPCASCHVSPAGGGMRNIRGQAWVASDRPAVVPSTAQALQILGITLPSNTRAYKAPPDSVAAPSLLAAHPAKLARLLDILLHGEGN
ncbi:MAG: hypothetical protein M1482_04220 [Chloroflexi bacterium]|nr:hypothetical protein [Chloroflexota bacterium]